MSSPQLTILRGSWVQPPANHGSRERQLRRRVNQSCSRRRETVDRSGLPEKLFFRDLTRRRGSIRHWRGTCRRCRRGRRRNDIGRGRICGRGRSGDGCCIRGGGSGRSSRRDHLNSGRIDLENTAGTVCQLHHDHCLFTCTLHYPHQLVGLELDIVRGSDRQIVRNPRIFPRGPRADRIQKYRATCKRQDGSAPDVPKEGDVHVKSVKEYPLNALPIPCPVLIHP